MQNSLYVALSSQIALERRLTTLADNVANSGTVGFRATQVKFEDVVTSLDSNSISFVSTGGTYLSAAKGGFRQTDNPLDFAIRGDAWFALQTPGGTVMTRDGRFTMLDTGELVSIEGYPVLDAGGAGIQLDPAGGEPAVGSDGFLRQNGQQVGVVQGFVEDSNVNPVLEMTRLIMVQRAFESAQSMIRETESTYDEAVKTLGGS